MTAEEVRRFAPEPHRGVEITPRDLFDCTYHIHLGIDIDDLVLYDP
jgi:hypothetical protein